MEQNKTILAFYLGKRTENPRSELLDWIICKFSSSRFSHVELVTNYDSVTGRGLGWTSSYRDGGVRCKYINFNTGRWELYEVPTVYSEKELTDWFSVRVGQYYDVFGAISTLIPFFRNSLKKWFCSEIVGTCLGVAGSYKMNPQQLFNHFSQTARRL